MRLAEARHSVRFVGGALFTFIVGTMGGKFVIELDEHRPGLARSGTAELDRLRLHSASAPI